MSTRACARCGTSVPADQFLCASCRDEQVRPGATAVATREAAPETARPTWRGQPVPPGMVLPSRVQYHGTVYALIAVGVAITLTLGVLVNRGVGPFAVTGVHGSVAGTVRVSATVTNQGDRSGRARCVATWTNQDGGPQQSGLLQTAPIAPGRSATVTISVPTLLDIPANLAVDCK